jgi:hypothetical protein
MKNLCKIVLFFLITFYLSSVGFAACEHEHNIEKNYFQFSISHYHTKRQSGQIVNIYVRYVYKSKLPKYPDYRILRTSVLKYMEPTKEFPINTFWEIIAQRIAQDLMHDFPLLGVSVQLEVLDNPSSNEPGDHGPTYTIGDIPALDIHH